MLNPGRIVATAVFPHINNQGFSAGLLNFAKSVFGKSAYLLFIRPIKGTEFQIGSIGI